MTVEPLAQLGKLDIRGGARTTAQRTLTQALTTALGPQQLSMRNSANGTQSQWYQSSLLRGTIATLVIGGGLLAFGRDSLFFYNGPGGDGWKIGNGGVHVFNAHFDRDLEKARAKALKLVNRDREANGLPHLTADIRLEEAAQNHAEDMAQRDFLSSFSPEGQAPSDRFTALGGQGFVAENIGVQGDDEQVTYRRIALLEREWMYERRDRENLLNDQFNQFGFGIAIDQTDGEVYAVQLFRNDGSIASSTAQTSNASTTSTSPAPVAAADATATPNDPFREAVNAAMAAAVAAQTAQTPQQWATVATTWNKAVTHMKAVAPDHPRHGTAQQKATEYSKNFDYARQNAGAAFAIQQPATAAQSSSNSLLDDLPATEAFNDAEAWWLSHASNWGMWFKLLLTLGGAGALIFLLTLEPGEWWGNEKKTGPGSKISNRSRNGNPPWHRRAMQEVQKFLEVKGWLQSGPEYKTQTNRPVQRVQRKLYRELLNLTQDEQAAIGLLKASMQKHPRKPVNWCCEQVIKELRQNMPPPTPSRSFRRAA